jgi:protein-S-isoprenylcysteine O-methyltransferase Ste14
MTEAMYVVGFNLAVGCAFGRVGGILIGAARTLLKRGRFERVRFGGVEALLALAGVALAVWTLLSWRELFVGHAVIEGQQLVTGGAYGVVRHPVYLAGLVIWCGLSLAFVSLPAAAITVFYVVPTYIFYIRSEEAMMVESFGDAYRRYVARVPMLLPRLRAARNC